MRFRFTESLLVSVILIMTTLVGCQDVFDVNTDADFRFSKDTITFDTVFSKVGSTTKRLMVYNRSKSTLQFSKVTLAGGENSAFRINVDGETNAQNEIRNIEISAHDSMYVFVEVTVDPNNSNLPVLISDSVLFQTADQSKYVRLEAYGQDVVVFRNKMISNDSVLSADKPYLIYGYLAVDSAKTLTIPAGCKLYFHNNANLIAYGNLKAEGTFENPVELRGDRFDKVQFSTPVPYNYVAGQWGGVYLMWNHGEYSFKHVNITNGYVGVYVENSDITQLPQLNISYCKLSNFVYYGLVAQNANVDVDNTEISNTGSVSVYLSGGKHTFIQSTIANYYSSNSYEPTTRDKNPAVLIMDLYKVAPMTTEFQNCIIAGGLDTEFSIASRFIPQYKGVFNHTYIKRAEAYKYDQFETVRWSQKADTLFTHPSFDSEKNLYYNFMPDSVSPARGLALSSVAEQYPLDLNGNNRLEDGAPDAGAYEWISHKN